MSALLLTALLAAQAPPPAQRARLEALQREVAGQIQLTAYDLLDELVFGLSESPPFERPTPVVLASLSVPVGLGTALGALMENHLSSVLLANPATRLRLSHCPACTAVLVHSGPDGTVVSRGVDDPAALAKLAPGRARHALFVDFEAEGSALVLRARITRLDEDLELVWSRTLSSAGRTAALLRQPERLKSAADARQELFDALADRGPLLVPVRLSLHVFNDSKDPSVTAPPFVWLQTGVELSLTQARAWTASLLLGYGWVPESYSGFMAQVRFHRLLTGAARSFTSPDLYAFFGASITSITGPSAQVFARDQFTVEDVTALLAGGSFPRQAFGALQAGLELRVGNRLGATFYGEMLPGHMNSDILGTYFGLFHSYGTEISVWF